MMMKIVPLFLSLVGFAAAQESILTEEMLQISHEGALLSALAYKNASEFAILDANGNITGYEHPDYEEISFFTVEPDQAILAKKDGRCYVAFRGTNANLADWEQNVNLGKEAVHQDNNETLPSCQARKGFTYFVRTDVVASAQSMLLDCVTSCTDPDDCVVITGHSQGGAESVILSILLYSLNPTVVTFGMPPALESGCTVIPSDRLYRYVNHRQEDDEEDDVGFDPVPFSPTFISGAVHYGHYLLVGPDPDAAKYLGFDQNYTFTPDFSDRQNEIASHTMSGQPYSYEARIMNLLNATSFPVSMDGFNSGVFCETQYGELCASGSCQNFMCADKLADLCVKGSCEEDNDCASGVCIWDACAAADGEVEPGCPCGVNNDCKSGDCDTRFTSFDWVCTGDGATDNGTNISAGTFVYGKSLAVASILGALFSWM